MDEDEFSAAARLNAQYQEDRRIVQGPQGWEDEQDALSPGQPPASLVRESLSPRPPHSSSSTSPQLRSDGGVFDESTRMDASPGTQPLSIAPPLTSVSEESSSPRTSPSARQRVTARSSIHVVTLNETLAESVDSFFLQENLDGGSGHDAETSDAGACTDGLESVPSLGEEVVRHARGSTNLLVLLPESTEQHIPLLAAQLISHILSGGSANRTVLWLLPDETAPAAIGFCRTLTAAGGCTCMPRELTCVPAPAGSVQLGRHGGRPSAFEAPYELPLQSGEVGFLPLGEAPRLR